MVGSKGREGGRQANKKGRGAGSGASQRGKARRFGSQGRFIRGAGMHSNHGWGRPVLDEVRGPGVINSSIIFVRHLILGITNAL